MNFKILLKTCNKKQFLFLFVTLFLSQITFSQSYKKHLPYKNKGLWGIIDTTRQVIIPPLYKKVKYIKALDYVQFDYKVLIDLSTATEISSPGRYVKDIIVGNDTYALFRADKTSTLISKNNNKTIELPVAYYDIWPLVFKDLKTSSTKEYFFGDQKVIGSDFSKTVVLKNDTTFSEILTEDYDELGAVYDAHKNTIAIATKGEEMIRVYDHTFKLIKTFTDTESYQLLTKGQLNILKEILNIEYLTYDDFSIQESEIVDDSWEPATDTMLPKGITTAYDDFFVTYISNGDVSTEIEPTLLYVNYGNEDIKTMGNKNIEIIIDKRYVAPGTLMFPKNILKEE